jgi:asparagine synthase (glutamine-hydrolysing)
MNLLAGALLFDGRPTAGLGSRIRAALAVSAPGVLSVYAHDSIVMACAGPEIWEDEADPHQPLHGAGGLIVTWDGRLDNRDDLRLALGVPARPRMSDAAIVLAAFERWGIDGLGRLVGEWSAVIWDRASNVVHLARDYMGVRPLYFAATDRRVFWATSLADIVRLTGGGNCLNDAFVAGFMTFRFDASVTPYERVHAVPAATCVSFSGDGMETRRRFWRIEPTTIRYRDRRQYEEHLRALWRESVGARLRTNRDVWAELSGGLDSSSVVCMADRLIKEGGVHARGLHPVSHVTLQSPEGDERRFIAEVEAQTGTRSEILGVEAHASAIDPEWDWVTPLAARGVGLAQATHIHDRGGALVLSGRVGDVVMGCDPDNTAAVFDDIADRRLVTAAANLRPWCRASRKPMVQIVRQLAARKTAARAARAIARGAEPSLEGMALLTPRLAAMAARCAAEQEQALVDDFTRVRAAKRDLWATLASYALGLRHNIPTAPPTIVHAYPFAHRPLVEFVLAIPGVELSAPGEMRSLMRRAFAGFVPARILRRTSKGYYPPSAMRAARPLAAALRPVERLEVVQRGWIDPKQLRAAITLMVEGGHAGEGVRSVIRLEQWLASRSHRTAAATSARKEVRCDEVLEA